MLGAIAGDIIGSVHEFIGQKRKDFPLFVAESRFTDDSVLTIAVADCLLSGTSYVDKFHAYTRDYPDRGYGLGFWHWVESGSRQPYNSWGNGSAMRVSPVGFAFSTLEEVLDQSRASAEVTHNHPEGVRGAQATAAAIFLARQGESKSRIRSAIETQFGYDLSRTTNQIRCTYRFNESCQETVPKRSSLSSTPRITKMPSGWQSLWAETPIRWGASRVGLPKRSTGASPPTSHNALGHDWTTACCWS
jgi:ADP-ribosylglycohydrolase